MLQVEMTHSPHLQQKLYLLQVSGSSVTGTVVVKTWTDTEFMYGYLVGANLVGLDVYLGPAKHYTMSKIQ